MRDWITKYTINIINVERVSHDDTKYKSYKPIVSVSDYCVSPVEAGLLIGGGSNISTALTQAFICISQLIITVGTSIYIIIT